VSLISCIDDLEEEEEEEEEEKRKKTKNIRVFDFLFFMENNLKLFRKK
jgi:hypothetical protein